MQPSVMACQPMAGTESPGTYWKRSVPLLWLVPILIGIIVRTTSLSAAEPVAAQEASKPETKGLPRFDVQAYVVEGGQVAHHEFSPCYIFKTYRDESQYGRN